MLDAERLIESALAEGRRACLTCSFQAEDVAVLHLLRKQQPDIPVLFLETTYHFAEVLEYRDRLAREWGLNVFNLQAKAPTEYPENMAACCHQRKVEPLMEGLAGYELWFTGLRRVQSPTRANLQPRELHRFPTGLTLDKVSPLYDWQDNEVFAYLAANDIPLLPLYDQGYTSIGCAPCTAKPQPGEHARSGRWGGNKLECGLHTVTVKEG